MTASSVTGHNVKLHLVSGDVEVFVLDSLPWQWRQFLCLRPVGEEDVRYVSLDAVDHWSMADTRGRS
jgi:hypothetical protein